MSSVSIAEASRQLSQIVNRASYGHEVVILTSRGRPKAVLVGVDAFQEMLGARQISSSSLMPIAEFRRQFQQALAESGYDTKEKIIDMVREVKREAYAATHINPEDQSNMLE